MPPVYSVPYGGYGRAQSTFPHPSVAKHHGPPTEQNGNTGLVGSYERAKQAVEAARRELEEQRRMGRSASYEQHQHCQPPQQSLAPPPPPHSKMPPPALDISKFCTQAVRPEHGKRTLTTLQDTGAHPGRQGYSSSMTGKHLAPMWATRGVHTPRDHRSSRYSDAPEARVEDGATIRSPRSPVLTSPCSPTAMSSPQLIRRKVLAIDLDETLVHSCFERCQADLYVPMTMEGQKYTAYVMTRPGVDQFLRKAVNLFDVVIWTASLECYAGPVINELERVAQCGRLKRMFRESCTKHPQGYVKDLRKLLPKGESRLDDVAIIDNSPGVAEMQPRNLIHVPNFYEDKNDRALIDLMPFLDRLAESTSVYEALQGPQRPW